jgi:2-polyprenyl-3-methyl-5-hydroxy-6-metoxy-1,4-benzoquinol methylase
VSVDQKVCSHFDADAQRFDAIYVDKDKGPLSRWIDEVWRGVVRRRLELALQAFAPLGGKTVLDVGCGSGRHSVAFAEQGAKVVGVDFAPRMIELAKNLARAKGVAADCDFRTGAFPEAVPDGPFDASAAIGFFDYIADPLPLVTRMKELTRGTMVMSFPKAVEWRVPLRRFRFWLKGCPLFLYSEARVKDVLKAAGLSDYDWLVLDRDYFVVARP